MPNPVQRAEFSFPQKTVVGVCIFLAAITWIVFGQTLTHQFINYDDPEYVADNPMVTGGLSIRGIAWAFTHSHSSNWHPLTWVSHMLDCQLFGLNPAGHHFTSVLLHTAAVILLFLLLREMTGALWRSAFVAAVFAIHPLRVESVAWVAERKDVLSGVFFMLTLAAYVYYSRKPSLSRFLAVSMFFVFGLMSKPMLVTLPCVLLLLDYWPLNRKSDWRKLVAEKIPLFGLSAASCFATVVAQGEAIASVARLPLMARIGNALESYVTYIGQMIWPVRLAVYYPYFGRSPFSAEIICSSLVLITITSIVMVRRREFPYLVTGWFWYLVMLVPVIGVIQVGTQGHADRYTYLPQIGLYIMATWLVVDLTASWRGQRQLLSVVGAVIIAAFAWCAALQAAYWRDSEVLSRHTLAVTTNNWVADNSLGMFLLERGRVDEAIPYFQRAVQIQPKDTDGQNNLGNALLQKGRFDEAMLHYQKALAVGLAEGEIYGREADYNLGNVFLEKGRIDEAIAHYRRALERPGSYTADAHNNLGLALHAKGENGAAVANYEKALAMKPDSASARTNLAWVLATSNDSSVRNGAKAVQLAEQANKLSGGANPLVLNTLACCLC
ncbi:MAG: tetratricopeptide repeat protein [Chthoniobacterales bacterium]